MAAVEQERPAGREAPLSLTARFVGEQARQWLGGWVAEAPEDETEALDALVVAARPEGIDRGGLERLADSCRRAGAAVVGVGDGPEEPLWSGLADVSVGPDEPGGSAHHLRAPRPFDPRAVNPLAFRPADVAGLACLLPRAPQGGAFERAASAVAHAVDGEPVTVVAGAGDVPAELPVGFVRLTPPEDPAALAPLLHGRLGAIDHPALHRSEGARAAQLVRLAGLGVPLAALEVTDSLADLLGPELADTLAGVTASDIADLDLRERISVAQRRAALRNHSLDARWRQVAAVAGIAVPERPKVSVILSTRRESWLEFGLEQVARQNYEPRELVVCLHGDNFGERVEQRVAERMREAPGELQILRVDANLTLGEALNQGVEAATGAYVTKMDDDDYYSVDHLWDLALAIEYSGADLVGKAAEFVYLEEIDVTIRQLTRDVETRLAGGGMMMRRSSLVDAGGWPSLTRGEDLAIVRRFVGQELKVHRTSPHGYILNRHGRDHTWRPYVDYFLFRSGRQWRGLRLDQTGIERGA